MSNFIKRHCPICIKKTNERILLTLRIDDFINKNSEYSHIIKKKLNLNIDKKFYLVSCQICNFVYSNEVLNKNNLHYLYNKVIDRNKSKLKIYDPTRISKNHQYASEIYSFFNIRENIKDKIEIFDFGCGWGNFLQTLKSPYCNISGLEIDNEKFLFAKKLGIKMYKKLPHKKFDLIIANAVFEHLDNIIQNVMSIKSSLKKNGILYVTVPNCNKKRLSLMQKYIKKNLRVSGEYNPIEHLNYFDHNSLKLLFETNGFKLVYPKNELFLLKYLRNKKLLILIRLIDFFINKKVEHFLFSTRLYFIRL